jgi:hypothetical protein
LKTITLQKSHDDFDEHGPFQRRLAPEKVERLAFKDAKRTEVSPKSKLAQSKNIRARKKFLPVVERSKESHKHTQSLGPNRRDHSASQTTRNLRPISERKPEPKQMLIPKQIKHFAINIDVSARDSIVNISKVETPTVYEAGPAAKVRFLETTKPQKKEPFSSKIKPSSLKKILALTEPYQFFQNNLDEHVLLLVRQEKLAAKDDTLAKKLFGLAALEQTELHRELQPILRFWGS